MSNDDTVGQQPPMLPFGQMRIEIDPNAPTDRALIYADKIVCHPDLEQKVREGIEIFFKNGGIA